MSNNIIKKIKGKSPEEIFVFGRDKLCGFSNELIYKYRIIKELKKLKPTKMLFCFSKSNMIIEKNNNICDIYISEHYLQHYFDLLGSGWKQNNYPEKENLLNWIKRSVPSFYANKTKNICKNIQKKSPEYMFINWQKDFKNNYYFDGTLSCKKIEIKENSNHDIKIPWELARSQHLPYLARLYLNFKDERFLYEIKNEILDFIAFNPVGYGVNWKCSMDVGIRIANWAMAIAICYSVDKERIFDDNFMIEFNRSILEHSIYLRYHLENSRNYRGNHFFANIIGLLFSTLYLQKSKWKKHVLIFSVKQFLKSIDEQFYEDGGNFESSIPYHKLTLEMAIYGFLVTEYWLNDKENKVYVQKIIDENDSLYSKAKIKLEKAMHFFEDSLKPNGEIYQLGDNDSGHLFRFYHFGEFLGQSDYIDLYANIKSCDEENIWDENELSGEELLSLINAINNSKDVPFFRYIVKNFLLEYGNEYKVKSHNTKIQELYKKRIDQELQYHTHKELKFPDKINLEKLKIIYYPCFGFYGYKSEQFYLGIFAGENGQRGRGGHSHNDKLSCEFQVLGQDMIVDPGSFVYTQSIKQRNAFRTTLAHYVPYFGEEQNNLNDNCFQLPQETRCEVLKITCREMIFKCEYKRYIHIRKFVISQDKLLIEDKTNYPILNMQNFNLYSNGYGKMKRRKND